VSETGIVKLFKEDKGFGFIKVAGRDDVFVHVSDLKRSQPPIDLLVEGDRVEFDLTEGRGGKGPKATNIRVLAVS
jgi:CspA family cold shock protein